MQMHNLRIRPGLGGGGAGFQLTSALSRVIIKSKIFRSSTVKVALNNLYFETDCTHLKTD